MLGKGWLVLGIVAVSLMLVEITKLGQLPPTLDPGPNLSKALPTFWFTAKVQFPVL